MNEEQSKVLPFPRRRVKDPRKVADFRETARRIRHERGEAAAIVERALTTTPPHDWPKLAEREELRTCGVLERLAVEVDARIARDPLEALTLAEIAAKIADDLSPEIYPPITRAQTAAVAWKDLGRALCYVSRYEDALAALDHASARLVPHGSLAHDQAIVRFARANVLQHLRRFDEAEALLQECMAVFRGHADMVLYAKCLLAQGNLCIRRGDHRRARMLLTPLLEGDPSLIPPVRIALGWCDIHLGSADSALTHFIAAARDYRRTGRDVETSRAFYGAASAMLRLGRFDTAIAEFRATRRRFLRHGLVEEAGLSGLGMVEAQIVIGETAHARDLAATLVREFSAANLNRRAVTALAYLNDAIAASSATPEVVRSVHAYIESLRTDPTREFAVVN